MSLNILKQPNKAQRVTILIFFVSILLGLLSACASINERSHLETNPKNMEGSAASLLNRHWRVDGKLAIRALTANPSVQTLRFDWQQQAQDFTVTLSGPLGFGRVTVAQQDQRVYLTKGKTQIEASDIDRLFAQQTGWKLPLSYLRYWALGLPSPEQPFTATNQDQHKTDKATLIGFQQDGWQIRYPSVNLAAPYPLPSKMIAFNKHFKVIMAFKHWQFPLIESSVIPSTKLQFLSSAAVQQ